MGTTRLGRLPARLRWRKVVKLLDQSPEDTAAVAAATIKAADHRLRRLANDPSLAYCYWLLTGIASASQSDDFSQRLETLGLAADSDTSALAFISRVSDQVRIQTSPHLDSGPFRDLATHALVRTLSATTSEQTPSMFGSSLDDLQSAVRQNSTPATFGDLAQRFFGDFISRSLRFFLDRELANHLGPGHRLQSIEAGQTFMDELDSHARQSAAIVRDFAGEWFSKHDWESQRQIEINEAGRFVAVALRKLRGALKHEADRK